MAWGQIAYENGQGKFIYNKNLGNVGPIAREESHYCHYGYCYRSFDNFLDAAAAYWRTIGKCAHAMKMFDLGMPTGAAMELKTCGYYESDVHAYTVSLASLYNYALKKVMLEEEREILAESQKLGNEYDYGYCPREPICAQPQVH